LAGLFVPSPKSHNQVVMLPVEVSVKVTVRGAVPEVGLASGESRGRGGCRGGYFLADFVGETASYQPPYRIGLDGEVIGVSVLKV
jgi:hypothetical protein